MIDEKGNKATSNEQKAQVLNSFFTSVFTEENLKTKPEIDHRDCVPLEDIEFSREEVLKKLNHMDVGKSPGPDSIHPRVLKELAEELAGPLAIIFTQSLD